MNSYEPQLHPFLVAKQVRSLMKIALRLLIAIEKRPLSSYRKDPHHNQVGALLSCVDCHPQKLDSDQHELQQAAFHHRSEQYPHNPISRPRPAPAATTPLIW